MKMNWLSKNAEPFERLVKYAKVVFCIKIIFSNTPFSVIRRTDSSIHFWCHFPQSLNLLEAIFRSFYDLWESYTVIFIEVYQDEILLF